MHVRYTRFPSILIEDRKPLAASRGSMARYGGEPKNGMRIPVIQGYVCAKLQNCSFYSYGGDVAPNEIQRLQE